MFDLPKARVLRGSKAFSDVFTRGKSITAGSVRLFYVPVNRTTPPRAGFSVSRVIRKATVRNRIKRCLREAFRLQKIDVPPKAKQSLDLVFLYNGGRIEKPSEVNCEAMQKDVVILLERLRQKTQK